MNKPYTNSLLHPTRRKSRLVRVGDLALGGETPIVVQSMTTTPTTDTKATVDQIERLVRVGCELVRITTPSAADVENLPNLRSELKRRRIRVPLAADVHFLPALALEACNHVEKVRVNPGNFADRKCFNVRGYTDAQYREELDRVRDAFLPVVRRAKENGVVLRIGTNHGSLSDRVTNRFGDTPLGMVESALEFVRIARDESFHDLVLSMKSSNTQVMVQAYRLLVARMDEEGMDYPLHLGLTEAGEGEDGRIKSAVGIGSLLADGLGDTIRVSLTEDPEAEIPVCRALIDLFAVPLDVTQGGADRLSPSWDFYSYHRRESRAVQVMSGVKIGGAEPVRVWTEVPSSGVAADPPLEVAIAPGTPRPTWPCVVRPSGMILPAKAEGRGIEADAGHLVPLGRALAAKAAEAGSDAPIHLRFRAPDGLSPEATILKAAGELGGLLVDGIGDSVEVSSPHGWEFNHRLAFNILQACRVRMFKTEYISCPSCGRTLFDLQETTERIRRKTNHLKDVKIAVMGCIVNGPGEMADADFGYVGSGPALINLYVGRKCVARHVPTSQADQRLIDLIREHGRWTDPT